jgi:hypothetical protein
MKYVLYALNVCLALPVFFVLVLIQNILKAFKRTFIEVGQAFAENKRYYFGIKISMADRFNRLTKE